MKPIINALGKLNRGKKAFAVFVLYAAMAITLSAQTFSTLFSFDGTDREYPYAGLVQATNGDFYGTTCGSGCALDSGSGTIFKITPSGMLTTLYSFCSQPNCADGSAPGAGLIQTTDGDLQIQIGGVTTANQVTIAVAP
jgi:uncharacterized repeat protein (TIGR03803 family)